MYLRAYIRKSKKYALKSYDTHDIHTLALLILNMRKFTNKLKFQFII